MKKKTIIIISSVAVVAIVSYFLLRKTTKPTTGTLAAPANANKSVNTSAPKAVLTDQQATAIGAAMSDYI